MAGVTASYKRAYAGLNDLQRRAVDKIFGPLLVVAGPGTGKTQLLATRVGNILNKTDAQPQNILCLTFTESARTEMQQRLASLIGPDGYKVAVHTFHSFGSHIMGAYGESFKEAFGFRAADDLTRYEIISQLLERLPYANPLSRLYNNEFLYLKDIQARTNHLRQAGLSPTYLKAIVQTDTAWLKVATPQLQKYLKDVLRVSGQNVKAFERLSAQLKLPRSGHGQIKPLGSLCLAELDDALNESTSSQTKQLTAWKNHWLTRRGDGRWVFKAERQLSKLKALAEIYQSYLASLAEQKLFDYDDMILNVSAQLEQDANLRADLQERYQYILVDEYQDTNGAQIKLLNLLADSPVSEHQPNLMVVGDDDQAIYGFQGAYASNLIDFLNRWRDAQTIVLNQNYRSTDSILKFIRPLISEGEDRLENKYPNLNKELASQKGPGQKPQWRQFKSAVQQYLWLSDSVKHDLKKGLAANQIAVLAPRHKYLEVLVPFLLDQNLPIAYEKRENILEDQHIVELTHLARVVTHLMRGEIKSANELMPQLLSFEWWAVPTAAIWQLNLTARQDANLPWLEVMRRSDNKLLNDIASWLLSAARAAAKMPLEPMLDILIGPEKSTKNFASPFRQYYFGLSNLQAGHVNYLRLLSSLVSLRAHLRGYQPNRQLKLADFVEFVDLRLSADLKIVNDHPLVLSQNAVQLMTVHRAKGQEFAKVYLINCDQHTWVSESGRPSRLSLPPNLTIAPAGDSADERLRLFYVAASRAKTELVLSSFQTDDQGVPTLPLGWLQQPEVKRQLKIVEPTKQPTKPTRALVRGLSFDWRTPHFELAQEVRWRDLLQPILKRYALNPSHLNSFLDVPAGGPKNFLVSDLLHFPKAQSTNASFGESIHSVMHRLHANYSTNHALPAKATAQRWLSEEIAKHQLGEIEGPKQLHRGRLVLDFIYEQGKTKFKPHQLSEYSFAGEGVVINGAHLSGDIDRADINQKSKTIFIVDYKTGKAANAWPTAKTKIAKTNSADLHRLHRYKYQLMFYKLLLEGSRSFGGIYSVSGAALEFLEPGDESDQKRLELNYDTSEMANFKKLVTAVWQRIMAVNLLDTSVYPPDFSGVLQFEKDLMNGQI